MTENILNYPPQSALFIDTDNQRVDVVDGFNAALKTIIAGGSPADAFGRQRVVEPKTLNDYKITYQNGTDYTESTTGTGAITFDFNKSLAVLTTGESAGAATHQTKMYHNYSPGKSQLILMSFVLHSAVEEAVKRLGYFDSKNGLFLQQDGDGQLSFVVRSDTSGSVQDTSYPQSEWNGQNVDWFDVTKTQLMFIDFQWLGVGRVRFGFVHDDDFLVAHTVYHSNVLEEPYMRNPNLPIRFQISGGTNATLTRICSTVISEGGYEEIGQDFSDGNTGIRAVGTASVLPLFAIKLNNTINGYENRGYVRYLSASLLSTGDSIRFDIIKLPSESGILGGTWTAQASSSIVSYNSTATGTVLTGAQYLTGGLVPSGGQGASKIPGSSSVGNEGRSRKNFIAQNFDSNDSEVFVIVAKSFTASSDVLALMEWREIY